MGIMLARAFALEQMLIMFEAASFFVPAIPPDSSTSTFFVNCRLRRRSLHHRTGKHTQGARLATRLPGVARRINL